MDRYVYVKSDESNLFFPDNKAFKFRVRLKTNLQFNGLWKVGLTEFHASINAKPTPITPSTLYVYTNLSKESIVDGEQQPLLRVLQKNSERAWSYSFHNIYYLPLKRKEFQEFEVYITCGDGKLASLLDSPVYMTLHFKQYPFYTDYEPF